MNLAAIKTQLEAVSTLYGSMITQHVRVNDDYSIEFLDSGKVYIPSATARAFHADKSKVKHLMGPFGSGKSTMSLMDIVIISTKMVPCLDGIRRLRGAVVRNTAGEIETSTYPSWMLWCDRLGNIKRRKKPNFVMHHTFNDGNGLIELELFFLGLDREDHLNKLKSTEFTFCYANELSELPSQLIDFMKGRLGRFPSRIMLEGNVAEDDNEDWEAPYWHGIISDTNPPDTDHWLYKMFEITKPQNYRIFKQPPGLVKDENGLWIRNTKAENLKYLSIDYYTQHVGAATEEFIKVYCCGEYGILINGKAIYPQYNDDIHSLPDIKLNPDYPLHLGWDFGLTPACVIAQHVDGCLLLIKEFVTDYCTVEDLANLVVKPWLNQYARDMKIASSDHDPSDPASAANGGTSKQILDQAFGLPSLPAVTNDPINRINAVKSFITKLNHKGKPCLQLSRSGCPTLRKGFMGDYHFRKLRVTGEEKYEEKPNKTHPISDIHDAVQYVSLRINFNEQFKLRDNYSEIINATNQAELNEKNTWGNLYGH